MNNDLIKAEARRWAVPLWQIAEQIGISEATMTRRLRKELSQEETDKMFDIIHDIVKTRKEVSL